MQDCWKHHDPTVRGMLSLRWCDEHEQWIVASWAKADGDSPFVDVHPMWQQPRCVPATSELLDTLRPLLSSLQATVQRLEREQRSGQMTLW